MRITAVFLLLAQLCAIGWAHAKDGALQVRVAAVFVELHAGPGSDYPVLYSAARSEKLLVYERKTDWFRVRTVTGTEGWVHRSEMEQTVLTNGQRFDAQAITSEEYEARTWEFGVLGGDFEGSTNITMYGDWHFTPNLSTELGLSQIFGNYSNSWAANLNLMHQAWPHWRISPFFTLGVGYISTTPKSTLVQAPDLDDYSANVGIGARMYLTRRFLIRADYRNTIVFTDDDDTNENIDEWKIGIGFFF